MSRKIAVIVVNSIINTEKAEYVSGVQRSTRHITRHFGTSLYKQSIALVIKPNSNN